MALCHPTPARNPHPRRQAHSQAPTSRRSRLFTCRAARPSYRLQQPPADRAVCANSPSALDEAVSVASHVQYQTVGRVRTLDDVQALFQANQLVTNVFYKPSTLPLLNQAAHSAYLFQACCRAAQLHSQPAGRHLTLLATARMQQADLEGDGLNEQPCTGSGSGLQAAGGMAGAAALAAALAAAQRAAAPGATAMSGPSVLASLAGAGAQVPVGVVNASIRYASPAVAEALEVEEGAPLAMISNMAVAEGFRRRGLARQLLRGCCDAALRDLRPQPKQLMLLVYQDYEPARRLYEVFSFQPTSWVDPVWLADAEKGRVRNTRRLLLARPLQV